MKNSFSSVGLNSLSTVVLQVLEGEPHVSLFILDQVAKLRQAVWSCWPDKSLRRRVGWDSASFEPVEGLRGRVAF